MHTLHKVLVHIPCIAEVELCSREKLIAAIREYAVRETNKFKGYTFAAREEATAGMWKDRYPQQIYLASENPHWFIKELEEVICHHKSMIDTACKKVAESIGPRLEDIIQKLWCAEDGEDPDFDATQAVFHLFTISRVLYGRYGVESGFYNTASRSARLCKSDLDMILENAEQWAMVMFDHEV